MQSLILFLLVGLGYALKRLRIFGEDESKMLVKLVLRVTLPTVIALSFIHTELAVRHARVVGTGIVSLVLLLGAYYFILRKFIKDRPTLGTALQLAFFSNMGFLGVPVIQQLFGEEGVSYAVLFGQVTSGDLAFFTVGIMICAAFSPLDHGKSKKELFLQSLKMPVVLAIPLGILLHFVPLPKFILDTAQLVAKANPFLIMFAVGLMLTPEKFSKKLIFPTLALCIVTLLIDPVIVYGLGKAFALGGLALKVAVLQMAMPSAVLIVVMAKEYKLNVELSESVLVASTILSLATLPMWLYFLSRAPV